MVTVSRCFWCSELGTRGTSTLNENNLAGSMLVDEYVLVGGVA